MTGILITGASDGIGAATARLLAEHGRAVVGIGRRARPDDFPGAYYRCDLTDAEQTAEVVRQIVGAHELGGVVNNAGLVGRQSIDEIDLMTLDAVLGVNLRAAIQIVQAVVPHLRRRGSGRIVNVVSRAIHGAAGRSAYSAAKSALVGCTRTWALEFAADGITVNAVAPGPTATTLFRRGHPIGSEQERAATASVPMGRLAEPIEVAAVIRFLLSEEAGFVTGQVLGVDGGASLAGR